MQRFHRVFLQNSFLLLAGVTLLQPIEGQAYEEPLHTYMSERAASNSVLSVSGSSSIWNDWGIPISREFPNSGEPSSEYGPHATNMNYFRLIGFGADVEDTRTDQPASHRSLNHFFNPQTGLGGGSFGRISPLWALEDVNQVSNQNYSLYDASRYFYRSFSSSSLVTRSESTGRMFQSLGHVIHHIQDMAQPQHARNDNHCSALVCAVIDSAKNAAGIPTDPPTFNPSAYEEYTRGLFDCGAFFAPNSDGRRFECVINDWPVNVQGQFLEDHPVPTFGSPRDFWTNAASQGMADFTSRHFISRDKNFIGVLTNSSNPEGIQIFPGSPHFVDVRGDDPTTPAPAGNAPESVLSLAAPPMDNLPLQEPFLHYVGGDFQDPITGERVINNAVSAFSALNPAQAKNNEPITLTMDRNVWDEARRLLMPRAVAYSTGLINHFFDARISMEEVPQNIGRSKWLIHNTGATPISGDVEVYSDDSSGFRIQVPNALYPVSLPPNSSLEVDGFASPLSTNGNFVAVLASTKFNQRIAEAAYQFSYVEEPLARCGDTLSAGGSSGPFQRELFLGERAGTVTVNFQPYQIPDSISITNPTTGTVFYSTQGLVSGRQVYKFRFDPIAENTDRVVVNILGNNDPGTRWNVELSCPDPDEDETYEHKVLFRLTAKSTAPNGLTHFNNRCEAVLQIDGDSYLLGVGKYPIIGGRPPTLVNPFLYEGVHDVSLNQQNCSCVGNSCGDPGDNYTSHYAEVVPFGLRFGNRIRIFVDTDGNVTEGPPAPSGE